MKSIHWLESSLEDIKKFSESVRAELGFDLYLLQQGDKPRDAKFLKTVGAWEIRVKDSSGAYRVAYVLMSKETITVVHCFKKKTQRTSKKDLDLIRKRLKEEKGTKK